MVKLVSTFENMKARPENYFRRRRQIGVGRESRTLLTGAGRYRIMRVERGGSDNKITVILHYGYNLLLFLSNK